MITGTLEINKQTLEIEQKDLKILAEKIYNSLERL